MRKCEKRLKSPNELRIDLGAGAVTTALVYEAGTPAGAALILGHGAGAGQRSPFIVEFAGAIAALGIDTITFNFLYTEQRRRIPDRGPALEACWRSVIGAVRASVGSAARRLFIGGETMGGRIATPVAAADPPLPNAGLTPLRYSLHPPRGPAKHPGQQPP